MHPTRLITTAAVFAMSAAAALAQTPAPGAAVQPNWTVQTAPAAAPSAAAPAQAAAAPSAPKVTPKGDLIETARASGQFNTFLKAVQATNLTSVLKTNKNLTVFAPTDAAFAALPPGELDRLMADKPRLQKLLTYHVINARVDSTKIRGAKGPVVTVSGQPVELDGSGPTLLANNADIIQADVMTTNGVLHVIDKVLTPSTAMAATASGASASTTAAQPSTSAPPAQTTTGATPPAKAGD